MDNYMKAILERFENQRNKGIEKYGQVLEQNNAPIGERLEHLAQELTDGLAYIEWIKECLATKRLYPRIKFANRNTLDEQFDHICEEYREAVLADGKGHRDEELADLEHSIQTYFDIRASQGIDINAVRQAVIEKNRIRGYYLES